MSILRLDGVRREIGDFVILDSISAALARGERVGLVGGNGAGKTTLLEIITGREEADGGRVHTAKGLRIGLLTQEANLDRRFTEAPTVRAIVRGGAAEVEAMEQELAELEARGAEAVESAAYASLRDRFEAQILANCEGTVVNIAHAADTERLWNTSNLGFPRLEAEAILLALSERGVCASAGAACSSGSPAL